MGFFTGFFGRGKPRAQAQLGTGRGAMPPEMASDALSGELQFVSSSNVACFQYHPENRSLMVEFHQARADGKKSYFYKDVPPEIVEQLLAAPSKGRFVRETFVLTGWPFD